MTAEELLRQGWEAEAAGNLAAAEAAYRQADELGDAVGAISLGVLLQRRGERSDAVEAFQRAEARGHREAGSCLGNLLSEDGDIEGARAAYERSIAAGSTDAVLNLGLTLAQHGAADDALQYLRSAQENGEPAASWAIGKLLEGQGDLSGAASAYRQGAVGGIAAAAFGLGRLLANSDDREGARAAFQRAHELGDERAGEILIALDAEGNAQDLAKLVQQYATACSDVLSSVNACLEVANRAVAARNMAEQRPQHEISIQRFATRAEESEREFAPLYQRFAEACTVARAAAAELLASQSDPFDAEMALLKNLESSVADSVATAKGILDAIYGPTPAAFLEGIAEANQLMANGGDGNIYRPPAATSSGDRTCPWCAETIKAAAVICRFCGRDVQGQLGAE